MLSEDGGKRTDVELSEYYGFDKNDGAVLAQIEEILKVTHETPVQLGVHRAETKQQAADYIRDCALNTPAHEREHEVWMVYAEQESPRVDPETRLMEEGIGPAVCTAMTGNGPRAELNARLYVALHNYIGPILGRLKIAKLIIEACFEKNAQVEQQAAQDVANATGHERAEVLQILDAHMQRVIRKSDYGAVAALRLAMADIRRRWYVGEQERPVPNRAYEPTRMEAAVARLLEWETTQADLYGTDCTGEYRALNSDPAWRQLIEDLRHAHTFATLDGTLLEWLARKIRDEPTWVEADSYAAQIDMRDRAARHVEQLLADLGGNDGAS